MISSSSNQATGLTRRTNWNPNQARGPRRGVLTRFPVAPGLHTVSGLGLSSADLLHNLDGFVMPFPLDLTGLSDEVEMQHNFPKLRCPAYKDGCQFATWHLKLMDAHLKAHARRVELVIMFKCLCQSYYHNLFDLFLHIQVCTIEDPSHANKIQECAKVHH